MNNNNDPNSLNSTLSQRDNNIFESKNNFDILNDHKLLNEITDDDSDWEFPRDKYIKKFKNLVLILI